MNHPAIAREELLEAAVSIVVREGAAALSVRHLAARCGISVGCVYNYFPSKGALWIALAAHFWKGAAAGLMEEGAWAGGFDCFLERAHGQLRAALQSFAGDLLAQLSSLPEAERQAARKMEGEIQAHMRQGLRRALDADRRIGPDVFRGQLTREVVAAFAFSGLMAAVRTGHGMQETLIVLRRILYGA